MYAVFVEVNADEAHIDAARTFCRTPRCRWPERPVRRPVTGSRRRTAAVSPLSSTTPKTKHVPWRPGRAGQAAAVP